MKLPIVFLCENNGWAEFTPVRTHMRAARVADRAETYGMPGATVPNEFFAIYEQAEKAVQRAREGEGPSLVEVVSSRWHGHFVGDAQKYRPEEDVAAARHLDCIRDFEQGLLEAKALTGKQVETIHARVAEEIEKAVAFARSSPPPDPSELMEDLYVG
jgi:pyruvate dehydrogenase E1 component alpha subunit